MTVLPLSLSVTLSESPPLSYPQLPHLSTEGVGLKSLPAVVFYNLNSDVGLCESQLYYEKNILFSLEKVCFPFISL